MKIHTGKAASAFLVIGGILVNLIIFIFLTLPETVTAMIMAVSLLFVSAGVWLLSKRTNHPSLFSHLKTEGLTDLNEAVVWETDMDGMFRHLSDNVEAFFGYRPEELVGKLHVWELHPQKDASELKKATQDVLEDKKALMVDENPVVAKDGSIKWVLSAGFPVYDSQGKLQGLLGLDIDVCDKKRAEQRLSESEKKFRGLFEHMGQGLVINELIYDENGRPMNYRIVDANPAFENLFGVDLAELKHQYIDAALNLDEPPHFDIHKEVAETGKPQVKNWYFAPLGKYFYISFFSHRLGYTAAIYTDITEKKAFEETIEYLSYRDSLTGLHNRRYYEESIPFLTRSQHLPLSIIVCDLNALGIANDTFGHHVGDDVIKEASNILKSYKREQDVLARVGGDEFIMLMPDMPREDAKRVIQDAKATSKRTFVGEIEVSMSFGLAVMNTQEESFDDLYSLADARMYRYKLHDRNRVRQSILDLIETRLYERIETERDHASNVVDLSLSLAKQLSLCEHTIRQVEDAARYHDLGKIAIDPEILNRAGPITEYEWVEVKRHPEIGFRILNSIPSLADVSQFILSHHENIDGTGYPQGLKGEEIPLVARILRICDAYDAMTSERPYKHPLTRQEALDELRAHKGTAFDASLVEVFIAEVIVNA